jgi:hypothetical protein
MKKSESGIDFLSDIDPQKQVGIIQAKFAEYGLVPTVDTFKTSLKIFWEFHNPGNTAGLAGQCKFESTTGDLLDSGGKNWFYIGTCSGTQYYKGSQHPITVACSLEYTSNTASLKWSISDISHTYSPISENSAGVQYKSDINGSPKVIVVRDYLPFRGHYMHANSFTTFIT